MWFTWELFLSLLTQLTINNSFVADSRIKYSHISWHNTSLSLSLNCCNKSNRLSIKNSYYTITHQYSHKNLSLNQVLTAQTKCLITQFKYRTICTCKIIALSYFTKRTATFWIVTAFLNLVIVLNTSFLRFTAHSQGQTSKKY